MSRATQDVGGVLLLQHYPSPRILGIAATPTTVANTTAETTLIPSVCCGSFMVTPDMMPAGAIIRFRNKGYISTGSGQESTLRVKFNGLTLIESTGTLPNNLENQYVELELDICVLQAGEEGKIRYQGRTLLKTSAGISTVSMRSFVATSDVTMNTLAPALLDQTYQWTTALPANSLTIAHHALEVLST